MTAIMNEYDTPPNRTAYHVAYSITAPRFKAGIAGLRPVLPGKRASGPPHPQPLSRARERGAGNWQLATGNYQLATGNYQLVTLTGEAMSWSTCSLMMRTAAAGVSWPVSTARVALITGVGRFSAKRLVCVATSGS